MNEVRQFRHIKQKFNHPIINSYGNWFERDSLVLFTRSNDGAVAFGEVAPTPGFLSFDFENVRRETERWVSGEEIHESSPLQPAISCLKADFWNSSWIPERKEICKSRLYFEKDEVWRDASTIKRKVGLLPEDEEILDLKSWFAELPVDTKVRLDPNQSWSVSVLRKWIDAFYEEKKIEFIEQPLPHAQIDEMFEMAIDSPIPFALDESIVALGDLNKLEKMNWNGYFVIKPTLLSDWPMTIEFISKNPSRSVLSTVFESPFGYEALLRSCTFSHNAAGIERKIYFGKTEEFEEHHLERLPVPCITNQRLANLWNSL